MTTDQEHALIAWVAAATGLDATSVMWIQTVTRRPVPYATLQVTADRPNGFDKISVDATDPDEVLYAADGWATATVRVTVFGATGATGAAGGDSPTNLLRKLQHRASLPTIRDVAKAEGLAPDPRVGFVIAVNATANMRQFEPRAYLDVVVHYAYRETAAGNYIASVELEDDDRDTSVVVDIEP